MKFAKLYKDNREAVERALRSMWCGESGNDSQRKYAERLRDVIKDIFAPDDAVPLVQCMNSYESVHSVPAKTAESLVGDLWEKSLPKGVYYSPFEHQYQCWHALLEEKDANGHPMSICVTTGTGSGKTECFMMPLVKDLIDEQKNRLEISSSQIQALFLYPLNALMEDQKERLEKLLAGTNLTYTVYNGDLPEYEPKSTDHSKAADNLRKRIRQIRGWDEKTKTYKFERMVYTRDAVRKNPPNILLTNSTMLEYILLRGTDAKLTNPELKSLRWIAIDETHTYTGAGAAELAMLLRRVLLAFGVKAEDIRFATSSATFGNGSDPKKEEQQLREFIAGITGVSQQQVKAIGGNRVGENEIPQGEDEDRWRKIFQRDYVSLNELYPQSDQTIEEKLALLDEMCAKVPMGSNGLPLMKAKVHYFYRVPNNGLFVRLTEHEDGAFKIYTKNTSEDANEEQPLLELSRCKHCGEYVAIAKINTSPGEENGTYQPLERDDSDMFDLEEDEEDAVQKYGIIGLAKDDIATGDNNTSMMVEGKKLVPASAGSGAWHLVVNTQCSCPYCNSKLAHKKNNEEEVTADATEEMESAYLQKFRTSADFISRQMAPSVLNQLEKGSSKDPAKIMLHDGQQFISFADSRQLAAKATLKQNLEQERLWVYSTIFHALSKQKAESGTVQQEIDKVSAELVALALKGDTDQLAEASKKIQALKAQMKKYFTWQEIADLLMKSKYCTVFCRQFVKRSGDSDELDQDGNIPKGVLEKYVHSLMVMYLSTRPASAAAPETMGLFHTHYPQLQDIALPEAVEAFNQVLDIESNRISQEDWHHLLQIFMDYTVRSNQSLFLKLSNTNPIDIFACERFATEKPRRRPIKKPVVEVGKPSHSRIVRYLCGLIKREKPELKTGDVYRQYFNQLAAVVDALWEDVNAPKNHLLEESVHWNSSNQQFERDSNEATRFNLANLCFKLYEDVYLCDTNSDSSTRHTVCLRPIENHFKGFAPYLIGNEVVELSNDLHEVWEVYPYYEGTSEEVTIEKVEAWAETHRSLLWNHHIWGKEGVFGNRLTEIHQVPNLFIQAEHTAQVDKEVSRSLQSEFKDHAINILACSTTMEMGVDLGNLEVVMLSSVPPQPSNYKQRAGRSGRNNKVCSVCITLCGSDAIGLRTLFNPLENIINRPVQVPMVDLMSPQVVQRHVNSYLVRAFGVFKDGDEGGKLTQKVLNYYTNFIFIREDKKTVVVDPATNSTQEPTAKLGDETGTMYARFNLMCSQALDETVRDELNQLLKGTLFEGHPDFVISKARENNERCYAELNNRLEDYCIAFNNSNAKKYPKFRNLLKMQYMEVLNERLLNYWATSRFTPNANMPVNVLTLDLSDSGQIDFSTPATSSNPSYGLRDAIAQYAPGNNIVVDGVAYVVRGIQFTNMYQGVRAFKQIFRNSDKCVIDDPSLDGKIRWDVNDKESVELVQPVGFVPDMNDGKTRIMETNSFTRVSAQLLDTTDWDNNVTEPHLFSVRSNRETGNAKILYYNEGLGYGYCFCSRCGRMTLETGVADGPSVLDKLPDDMNTLKPKTEGRPRYHHAITGKELHSACSGSNNKDCIRRNVIIGDLVQTDYAEIRIRHKGAKRWMNSRSEDNLLFTLGIVFTQSLLDILGKERGAIDFAVMPNGHLCLFDTNPGGAGYANQMASVPLMKDVITASKQILLHAKERNSKDMLLDKFTLRFMKYVDIDAALDWIEEEEVSRGETPEEIAFVSKDATETDIVNLERAFAASSSESILFVNDSYAHWNYNDSEHGWRTHYLHYFNTHQGMTTVCVVRTNHDAMPEPILDMVRSIKSGWAKDVVMMDSPYGDKSVYPIAYIDGNQYFTNNAENATLDDAWGNKTLYCARVENILLHAKSIDCSYKDSTKVFILSGHDTQLVKTKELGEVIQNHSGNIINGFVDYCKSNGGKIHISYQDEHLKSVMGMVLTLQTIGHLIKQIGKEFELEFLVERFEDNCYKASIMANLKNSSERDMRLGDLCEGWLADMEHNVGVHGELVPIESRKERSLTHWRVLSFECGNKRLHIYPDGGFANGWNLQHGKEVHNKFYTLDNTDTNDNIALERAQDIKFDVSVEDI